MQRHPRNPLIEPDQVVPSAPGYRVRGAFNPAAVRFDGEVLLLLRVAEDCPAREGRVAVPVASIEAGVGRPEILELSLDDPDVALKDTRGIVYKGLDYLSTMSHIRIARSRDGVSFQVDDTPFIFPGDASECFGVEDARVTRFGDTFAINYTCVSPDGWGTALATTRDFRTIERRGLIFTVQNKDVSIFPESIDGLYRALHRPNNSGFGRPSIWYAESPDLIHWGNHQCILRPRDTFWEEMKIGGGAPCIKTPQGWLQLYHAKGRNQIYSLFTVLLDLEQPWRVLKRGSIPILRPEMPYETDGFFPNVVFCNGVVTWEDGRVFIYYGACDESVCLLETTVAELLASVDAA
ncbi:glycosidase [Thiohalocapsa halophila]|uniref:Glycosidase n=1 Tax=Thiohalocapsa halophila TaxID=69359 RepID=A0ABS1CIR0_9GAMM|nr:glycoside hydrolase family 130 protein [Thiohalocapsa halophila]MBK1631820.1 glycosidase [Thiohalocapsa halophila]